MTTLLGCKQNNSANTRDVLGANFNQRNDTQPAEK